MIYASGSLSNVTPCPSGIPAAIEGHSVREGVVQIASENVNSLVIAQEVVQLANIRLLRGNWEANGPAS